MISQRFILPVITAAAIHAALFAFVPPRPPTEVESVETVRYVPLPPLPFLLEPPPLAAPAEKSGGGGEPVATLPEPPVPPKAEDFAVVVPELSPVRELVRIDRIPRMPGPFGGVGPGIGAAPTGPIGREFLDHEPRARARIAPDYPYDAKSRGLEGSVEVAFVVGPDGAVHSAHVVRSDHRELESAAVRAVMKWRFEPGKYQGRPVSFRMSVPIVFRIAED